MEEFEAAPTDDEKASEESKAGDGVHKIRDGLLSDLRMFSQMRTTVWKVENPGDFSPFLKLIPKEVLEKLTTDKLIRHAHNWAITTDYWNSCKSLNDFFTVLGIDDGLP